jgi:hemerythrin-like domain-containing protein
MTDVKIVAAKASGMLKQAAAVLSGEPGIFSTLRGEHQELRSLINRLLQTTDDGPGVRTRLDLIDFIRNELIAHARAEEREFYALMKQYDSTRDAAGERLDEHQEIERWVEELMSMPPADPMWMASFESFAAAVEHHIQHEEDELLPRAQELFDDEQARQIGQLYREEKLKQLSDLRGDW